jgi:hypothetical protein
MRSLIVALWPLGAVLLGLLWGSVAGSERVERLVMSLPRLWDRERA